MKYRTVVGINEKSYTTTSEEGYDIALDNP
jgi:hypothetical protein